MKRFLCLQYTKFILLLRAVNPSILQLLGLLDCSRKLRFAAMASLNFCRPCRWPHWETRDPNPGKTHPQKTIAFVPSSCPEVFSSFSYIIHGVSQTKTGNPRVQQMVLKKIAGKMGTSNSIVWVVTIPNKQSILVFVQNFLKIPLWKIYHHRNNANNVEIPHYILPSQLSCTLHIQDNLLKNDTYLEIDKMDTILQIPPEGNTTNWPGLVQTILQDTNLLGNGFGVVKRRIHATTLGHFLGNPWSPVIPESLKTWFFLKSGAPKNNQIS